MKIDRLIGILSVLLQKERTTAPEPTGLKYPEELSTGILRIFASWYSDSDYTGGCAVLTVSAAAIIIRNSWKR